MKKNIEMLLILFICVICSFHYVNSHDESKEKNKSVNFYFDDQVGDSRRVTTLSQKDIRLNNELISTTQYKFITNLNVKLSEKKEKITVGEFFLYQKSDKTGDYVLFKKFNTEFTREKNGFMKMESKYFFPSLKDIPTFPGRGVEIGQGWEGNAVISQDLRKYGLAKPVIITVKTHYRYLKNEIINKKECAVISVYFIVNQNNKIPIGRQFNKYWITRNGSFITRWMGIYKTKYYYSFEDKELIKFDADYNHLFFYENGNIHEVKGNDKSLVERKRK
ncbi:MAG: hypothetical protein OEV44_08715 [Spirochaetota bacterium]|nr:hypothetical protein [Spirochaetota bacterium]